ncbi:MAG: hypothetical protein Q7U75_16395, partial [Desulfobacterales bacterium]|nr:hypothetical protein [Desulfobacterales bacterium]
PLVLVNHTKFPITLLTNFICRSQLKVMIRPEGQAQFRYIGPNVPAAYYAPAPFRLFPMDEYHTYLVIWADWEAPGNLAISKPGTYLIDIRQQIAIDEGTGGGELKYEGGMFSVTVDPTPTALEPLVELLKKDQNLLYLQLNKPPAKWGAKTLDVLKQFPSTPFTPWLCFALANHYAGEYTRKPTREIADSASYFYAITISMDSPMWEEAYFDMLQFYDELELAVPIAELGRKLLAKVSEDRLGHIGNDSLLQKYLINTAELDPTKYWALLP